MAISKSAEKSLRDKAKKSSKYTLTDLKKVYSRGQGAFLQSGLVPESAWLLGLWQESTVFYEAVKSMILTFKKKLEKELEGNSLWLKLERFRRINALACLRSI